MGFDAALGAALGKEDALGAKLGAEVGSSTVAGNMSVTSIPSAASASAIASKF